MNNNNWGKRKPTPFVQPTVQYNAADVSPVYDPRQRQAPADPFEGGTRADPREYAGGVFVVRRFGARTHSTRGRSAGLAAE